MRQGKKMCHNILISIDGQLMCVLQSIEQSALQMSYFIELKNSKQSIITHDDYILDVAILKCEVCVLPG